MKYVVKNYEAAPVVAHEEALKANQLDEDSLLPPNESYPGQTGTQLFDKVKDMDTYPSLKQQMYEDQGGICCYCGMKLEYPFDPQYRVEHVLPKEKHRELSGEYKNLLLSCKATQEEKTNRANAAKSERKKMMHCDEAKESKEITYSPLQEDCKSHFIYGLNGEVKGTDDSANEDIKVLRLDCDYLVRRRREAIQNALFDGLTLLDDELLIQYQERVKERKTDNRFIEFCFVIESAISQLLQ